MIYDSKYLQLSRSSQGILKFPPYFSIGVHIDFKKKYIDFHFYDFILTIGNSWYHQSTPKEVEN